MRLSLRRAEKKLCIFFIYVDRDLRLHLYNDLNTFNFMDDTKKRSPKNMSGFWIDHGVFLAFFHWTSTKRYSTARGGASIRRSLSKLCDACLHGMQGLSLWCQRVDDPRGVKG